MNLTARERHSVFNVRSNVALGYDEIALILTERGEPMTKQAVHQTCKRAERKIRALLRSEYGAEKRDTK